MTPDDLSRIEAALGITLPEAYRQAVVPYPVPALRGNTDWMFWDDAEALISLNKRLRQAERFREPWPPRFFALGEDAGGCSDAIDLKDPEFGVFWFDRQIIDVGDHERSDEKLPAWIARQIRDSSDDLEGDGIDPQGTPEDKDRIQEENSKGSCLPLLLFATLVGVAGTLLVWTWKLLAGS